MSRAAPKRWRNPVCSYLHVISLVGLCVRRAGEHGVLGGQVGCRAASPRGHAAARAGSKARGGAGPRLTTHYSLILYKQRERERERDSRNSRTVCVARTRAAAAILTAGGGGVCRGMIASTMSLAGRVQSFTSDGRPAALGGRARGRVHGRPGRALAARRGDTLTAAIPMENPYCSCKLTPARSRC